MEKKQEQLEFPLLNKKWIKVKAADILYLEASDKLTLLHFIEEDIPVVKHINLLIGKVESLLDSGQFFRTHKSYILNIVHIQEYGSYPKNDLLINGDKSIPLSRRKKLDFHNAYIAYHSKSTTSNNLLS
jgi:two-component system LytT family response regulator